MNFVRRRISARPAGWLFCLLIAAPPLLAQHPPTPAQRAAIDRDNAHHFGDDPADGGPLAKNLSPALRPNEIQAAMRKVADWELARAQPYFDSTWTSAVLYVGLVNAAGTLNDPKYSNAVQAYGETTGWAERSHVPGADDQAVGQSYLDLYSKKKDPSMIAPTREALDRVIAGPDEVDGKIPWWWCDALFMAPPVWVRMAAATGDHKYVDYMNREFQKTSNLLWDPSEHLYFRDATYLKRKEANGQPMFWSRGNGWVMAGIARTLDYLPKTDPRRSFYVQQLKEMAAKVRSIQGKDGLWRSGLLDPDAYVLPENSGSALFTFAMAWGVNHGILDRRVYRPVIAKAWKGLLSHIYADGRLGCIQQTGAAPAFYRPTASYDYGVGAFLMAGSEIDRMSQKKH